MATPSIQPFDCHTHTVFSDGSSTFEENIRAAAEVGCRALVSTDHLTEPASMDPTSSWTLAECDLPAHRSAFETARELARKIAPAMELIYGFECDWYEGCEPLVERWSAGAAVRLGSVHWLGDPGDILAGAARRSADGLGWEEVAAPAGGPGTDAGNIDDSDEMHLWHELGADEIWRRYVRTWCQACESPLAFDVMAHPDLPMRFANEGFAPTIDVAPLWDEMAACARDTRRRVELSTAGLRKGVGDYYPSFGLLERFARAGVPLTLSTDAHRACDICWGFDKAVARAYEAGYRAVDMPHADGSWERIELA